METMENQSHVETQMFQRITYVLYKCRNLQELFLKWTGLKLVEKQVLNCMVLSEIPNDKNNFFVSIMKGFHYWEQVQDNEGLFAMIKLLRHPGDIPKIEDTFNANLLLQIDTRACGFHENPVNFNFASEDEKFICNLMCTINLIVTDIIRKNKLLKEIVDFKSSNLKSGIMKRTQCL